MKNLNKRVLGIAPLWYYVHEYRKFSKNRANRKVRRMRVAYED